MSVWPGYGSNPRLRDEQTLGSESRDCQGAGRPRQEGPR